MRSLLRWLPLVLVALLVLSTVPVQAQNSSFVVVPNPSEEGSVPPAPLLAEEEVAKIVTLQQGVSDLPIVSDLSPDGQVVLAFDSAGLGFLNVNDGSVTLLPPEATSALINTRAIIGSLFGLSEKLRWLDNDTLVGIKFDSSVLTGGSADSSVPLIFYNRQTNESGIYEFPAGVGYIGLAPNASKILVTIGLGIEEVQMASAQVTWQPVREPLSPLAEAWLRERGINPATFDPSVIDPTPAHMLQATAEPSTIGVLDLIAGSLIPLLEVPAGSTILGGAFDADGTRLALTLSNVEDRTVTSQTVDGALLSSFIYRDVTGQLPPSANPIVQNNVLYDFNLETGERRELRPLDNVLFVRPEWSPDGQVLKVQMHHGAQFVGRQHPVYTPQFVDRASYRFYDANLQEITRLDNPIVGFSDVDTATWLSSSEVLFNVPNGTNYHIWYFNPLSGEFRNITASLMGSNRLGVAVPQAGTMIFTHQSYVAPPARYKLRLDGTALERLTWDLYELELYSQTQMNPVSFQLADGVVREGVLIQPRGAPFPPQNERIIVWQQGGPVGPLLENRWYARVEDPYALLPNFGMSVLVVPLAGRRGLDAASYRAMADGTNFGQRDIDEMAEIVRQIHALGWSSPAKTGITGCSYGGYFTLQSIVRHPDLYAAANDQCALTDTIVEWTRGFDSLIPMLVGQPPYENFDDYLADSPFYNAGRINTPLLTFKGSDDFLPVTLSENVFTQLAGRGLPVRFVKFMGEGHGLSNAENEVYAAQEQITWFRTYLAE